MWQWYRVVTGSRVYSLLNASGHHQSITRVGGEYINNQTSLGAQQQWDPRAWLIFYVRLGTEQLCILNSCVGPSKVAQVLQPLQILKLNMYCILLYGIYFSLCILEFCFCILEYQYAFSSSSDVFCNTNHGITSTKKNHLSSYLYSAHEW